MTSYHAYQEELLRRIAEASGVSFEDMGGRFYSGGFVGMREINPQDRPKPPAEPQVVVFKDPSMGHGVYVRFPRKGLDDGILYGPNGYPENIGPTQDGPAQWRTAKDALAHFVKVHEAMETLL